MADVSLYTPNGTQATYNNVTSLVLPTSGGGTATFTEGGGGSNLARYTVTGSMGNQSSLPTGITAGDFSISNNPLKCGFVTIIYNSTTYTLTPYHISSLGGGYYIYCCGYDSTANNYSYAVLAQFQMTPTYLKLYSITVNGQSMSIAQVSSWTYVVVKEAT